MSCGVGHRCSSDPVLLCLWYRPVATAPIGLLAWEPPYAAGVALESKKKKKKKKKSVKVSLTINIKNALNHEKGFLITAQNPEAKKRRLIYLIS